MQDSTVCVGVNKRDIVFRRYVTFLICMTLSIHKHTVRIFLELADKQRPVKF